MMKGVSTLLVLFFAYNILFASMIEQEPRVLFAHYKSFLFGGVASDVVARSKAFLRNNVKSILLVAKGGARIAEQLKSENQQFCEINFPLLGKMPIGQIREAADLIASICNQQQINIIICTSLSQIEIAKILKKRLGIKIIALHHSEFSKASKLDCFQGIDGFIGVNNDISSTVYSFLKKTNTRMPLIATIKPFLDDQKFLQFQTSESRSCYFQRVHGIHLPADVQIVTSVSLFYGPKGQGILLKAAAKTLKKNDNVHFMFAGEGCLLTKAKQLANDLGIANKVHFLGFCKDIPALLHHSDIHVLSSTYESVGLATLEAALMGKPALAAKKTGAKELIIDGVTGCLFNSGSDASLADKLLFLLENKEYRVAMGAAAKEHVLKHFSSQVTFEKTLTFLKKIVNRPLV
jgi:glycosyltransferase involved in cell wall biosynthesis